MSPPSSKKQKYHNYKYNTNKRHYKLDVGMRGFLATCNYHIKDCIRECYNILNEYADEMYGQIDNIQESKDNKDATTDLNEVSEDADDISDQLEKEANLLRESAKSFGKDSSKFRFQSIDTGADKLLFIRTTLTDPIELGMQIFKDLKEKRKPKSRFLLRLIPIAIVCRANIKDIANAIHPVIENHFTDEPTKFSVVFNKRYNNVINRDQVILTIATIVFEKCDKNRVDLKHPIKTVIVEIIKGFCCLSVIDNYYEYKKCNLLEICKTDNETAGQCGENEKEDENEENKGDDDDDDDQDDNDTEIEAKFSDDEVSSVVQKTDDEVNATSSKEKSTILAA